ncbi:hypothetical protein [Chryseobacterium indologenes]|uniref:hypothetical protein n=1 Tax=Chryseobacterium indologenes TaxID=253 RepID=UPI001628D5DD|nr:hypothetical protein [Chryseobacterium indologenes]
MEKQTENQKVEKISQEEFFKQMKSLLEKAPSEVIYSVLVLEDPNSRNILKEGILSMQGSPKNITNLFNVAFNRSHQIKDLIFDAVEYYKFQKFSFMQKGPSIFEAIFGQSPFGK